MSMNKNKGFLVNQRWQENHNLKVNHSNTELVSHEKKENHGGLN